MSLKLHKPTSFQVPPGVYRSCCTGIYDLGTHRNDKYGKSSRRVLITWEIPDVRLTDGRPATISREYTNSSHEHAALRRDLEAWTGRGIGEDDDFELDSLLGEGCFIQVMSYESNGATRSRVNGIMPLPKAMSVYPESPLRFFSIDDGTEMPEGTPEWVVRKIEASPEYQQMREQSRPDHERGASWRDDGDSPEEHTVAAPL
jgi:hypothetical protein